MLWTVQRLTQHPQLSNSVEIAIPGTPFELAPALHYDQPKLKFDLNANETIPQRLAAIEKLANVEPGTYSLNNYDFWNELRVVLTGDEITTLDDTIPIDQLRIAFLRAKETVTQRPDEMKGKRFNAFLTNVQAKGQADASAVVNIAEAYTILAKADDKRQLLVLVDNTVSVQMVRSLSDNDVTIRLGKLITLDPTVIVQAWNDPSRAIRWVLRRAVANGLISKMEDNYYLTDDMTVPIASNENKAIEWLRNPENNPQIINIQRVLETADI